MASACVRDLLGNDLLGFDLRRVSALQRDHCGALVHGSRTVGEPRSTSWPSWRQQVHDLDMKSRVHPKYKTQYHVGKGTEVVLACNILNQMTGLGRPMSYRIGR